jgi:RNA polymerase sigma factor (sigma-70 family)
MSRLDLPVYKKKIPRKHHNKVVMEYLPLVELLARQIYKRSFTYREDIEDLINEGTIGLIDAIRKFDGRCQLTSYVNFRIIGQIKDYLRGLDPLSRDGRYLKTRNDMFQCREYARTGRRLSEKKILRKLKISRDKYYEIMSTDKNIHEHILMNSERLHSADPFEIVADKLILEKRQEFIRKQISLLTSPRQREIAEAYFFKRMRPRDIARHAKCTTFYISMVGRIVIQATKQAPPQSPGTTRLLSRSRL